MKIFRNLLKASTLTTALFIFQACYGTPQDPLYFDDGYAPMTFVMESTDGAPLEGIQVRVKSGEESFYDLGVTDAAGRCKVDIPYKRNDVDSPYLRFQDPNGNYFYKDTTLADLREREIVVKLREAK